MENNDRVKFVSISSSVHAKIAFVEERRVFEKQRYEPLETLRDGQCEIDSFQWIETWNARSEVSHTKPFVFRKFHAHRTMRMWCHHFRPHQVTLSEILLEETSFTRKTVIRCMFLTDVNGKVNCRVCSILLPDFDLLHVPTIFSNIRWKTIYVSHEMHDRCFCRLHGSRDFLTAQFNSSTNSDMGNIRLERVISVIN